MNTAQFLRASILLTSLIVLLTAPFATAGSVIKGTVAAIQGGRVKIAYEGALAPNVGDAVEIGFRIDNDLIPVEGKWKIVEVGSEFVWAEAEGGRGGEPSHDYSVVIHSDNPKKRTASARPTAGPTGSDVSHRGTDNLEVPAADSPFIFEEGYDRPGGEYVAHHRDVSTPQTCLALCRGNAGCVAFTWVKPNIQGPTGVCWLKGSLSRKVSNGCCVSGIVKTVDEDLCRWQETGGTYSCFCQNSTTKKWYITNPGICPGPKPPLR